jgi:glycosyltransferase involved in cell wall biosynthesis
VLLPLRANPLRILVVNTHRQVVGGVETYLREVLPALVHDGHEVSLLVERSEIGERGTVDERVAGTPVWQIDTDGTAWSYLARWRPDVVYSQGLEDPACEEALLGRCPTVLFAHNYHGTCVSGTKRHAWPVPCPCDRQRGPGCLLYYYPRRCGGLSPVTLLRHYHLQRRRGSLLPRYQAVLIASRHMRQEYLRHGVPEERLHLTPLFPPGDTPNAQPPTGRQPTSRVLLVGRLTDLKGGDLLVRAMRQAADALRRPLGLVVAGDGPERARLEALARQLDVATEFHGWVDADRRHALMRGADLLAVPSVWPEPFGLVGVEAACTGLPAVAFAVGGIPDWLRPGQSGELAPADPPTAAGLAAALVRALADPDRLASLRLGAWRVAADFTLQKHVDGLLAVLHQAVGELSTTRQS